MSLDTGINLVTLAEAKSFIEGSTTGATTYDSNYENIINAVSWRFNVEAGRHLKAQETTERYDGNGGRELYLNNYPINSTGITCYIDSSYTFTTDYLIDSTDILIYASEGKIWRYDGTFPEGNLNIKIICNMGYSSSSMPEDLKRAALETCSLFWNREDKKDRIGIRTESYEGGSRTYETDLPWSAKQILEYYRCHRYF
ncbi:MAG: hypothetical protein WC455_14060 [Dehalococcoidia bacterium]|jgi:hypothetical protein